MKNSIIKTAKKVPVMTKLKVRWQMCWIKLRKHFVSRSYFEVEKPIMCKYSEKHTEAECKLKPLRAEMYKCDLCLHSIDYRRPKKEYDIDGGYKWVYPK